MADDPFAPDPTAKKQSGGRFRPGQSGNPAGRPTGARNKLTEAFVSALQQDFEQHGVAAIARVRQEKPAHYLKVIASLVSREVTVNAADDRSDLSDDELMQRARDVSDKLAPLLADWEGREGIVRDLVPGSIKTH